MFKKCNVFIDIMRCSYMPDDREARKKLSTKLFLIRCIEHYKELGEFPHKLAPKYKPLVEIASIMVPVKLLQKLLRVLRRLISVLYPGIIIQSRAQLRNSSL